MGLFLCGVAVCVDTRTDDFSGEERPAHAHAHVQQPPRIAGHYISYFMSASCYIVTIKMQRAAR